MVDRLRSYRVMRLRPVVGVLDAQALRLLLNGLLLETGLVLHLDHLLLSLDPRVRQSPSRWPLQSSSFATARSVAAFCSGSHFASTALQVNFE